ncbi:zinc-finger protein [Amylibacter marinus]|uniref:Zinc-finger protein n=1 Tax=Amylibacter marinus TaxID=1475483 RepID=A0ABQ5VTT9_9RHOB|nr:DUF983 domain-containing protein [Amylibacter marinus]GLQ34653.1 zinc-finger protein [Amylibacter marinus]
MTDIAHAQFRPERDAKKAMITGWKRKCPNCGTGEMMNSYLSVNDACPDCGEELHHHRSDDGPAYVTVLISAHLFGALMLHLFEKYRPDVWVLTLGVSLAFIAFASYMLPRVKGCFVALQWAKYMHGFGQNR